MLPNLANNDNESGQERPSLPSIRDLFGEHLSKPVSKRSSPFSLAELGSSLPSRSSSPADSSVSILSSTMTSPRSQTSGQHNISHAGTASYPHTRRRSDSGSLLLTTSSTSPSQEVYITLPPINQMYSQSYRDTGRRAPSPYKTTSSRRISNSHGRSYSTSEAITLVARDSLRSERSRDPSFKRRHTIGSSRSSTSMRYPYPMDPYPSGPSGSFSLNSTRTSTPISSRPPFTNPYPAASTHPSLTRNLAPVVDYTSPSSCPPSPPSTSGEDVSTERKKTPPAKYECQYCGKRFNRPSSLKLHHNTHTGEKPFACPFPGCGRYFSVMSNMRRHARIHGAPSNRAPRDSSVDDSFEASTVYSSSSSTHNTPIIPQAEIILSSEPITRSHLSSATSLPHTLSTSGLEMLRHSSLTRPHDPYPYRRSQSPLSD